MAPECEKRDAWDAYCVEGIDFISQQSELQKKMKRSLSRIDWSG